MRTDTRREKEERPPFWMRGWKYEITCIVIPAITVLIVGSVYLM